MKKICTILLLLLSLFSHAQAPEGAGPNLIPNSGFESMDAKLPAGDPEGGEAFKYSLHDWKSPTRTTPDLKILLPTDIQKAQEKGQKYNRARSGNNCVAIQTHSLINVRSSTYREYIQVKLIEPIKKGKEYYFEYWVCREAFSKFASNNLGFALSPEQITRTDSYTALTYIQPDFNHTAVVNEGERKWIRISGTIVADEDAAYFILGNFCDNEKTTMLKIAEDGYELAYYLIDDITLNELNTKH